MKTFFVSPTEAQQLIDTGAKLVDIRERDEHAREHIPGAINVPLARLEDLDTGGSTVVFHCRTGTRTRAHADQLAAAVPTVCYVLDGGIEAWRRAGMDTEVDRRQPLELMRQVQLVAGGLVLLGVLLGFLVGTGFFALSAFVGAGLMFAGATGWCGMARMLRWMPWNRRITA